MEYFPNSIDAGGLCKGGPEILANMFDSIDSQTVDGIRLDNVRDPSIPRVNNIIILRVHISKGQVCITEPALLNSSLVIVIVGSLNETFCMEIVLGVERGETRKIGRVGSGSHVVDDDINHQIHIPLV